MSTSAAQARVIGGGRLADNVLFFTRVLRRAGLPIGPAGALDALQALQAVGLSRRDDFYYALSTVLVDRHEQQEIFDQAFDLFWRDPEASARMEGLRDLLAGVRAPQARREVAPRLAQAMQPGLLRPPLQSDQLPPELRVDASMTMSPREALQAKDFAAMTAAELAQTRRLIATLRLPLPRLPARRSRPCRGGGSIDLRATMREVVGSAAGFIELRRRAPRTRPATLVVLCDISGSMERYSRMLLHFMHALSSHGTRMHAFLFGTRLSNVTRALRDRDVDTALARVSRQVSDWAGGTRIGACLHEFNRCWARRLLGQGATVLLITDGLDSDDARGLAAGMERLHLSCRRLVWLNPLLRYAGFEAKPAGIRAMLPHADLFLPVHNLDSLARLGEVLETAAQPRPFTRRRTIHPAGDRHGNV
ncbi:vWA domain-containing protein [Noviherbaspirillum aridicola]|uniref:VWA domain-containing protein n=1 Tax=Noviherbaspirillum aridicola TaxID=2849687 RepID=A0ABQ4PZ12_9BURK|nr:VWA domain-containing protein [Noviherbaspirillum aridicola]GIZ50099.1 VWA domain-containing protein [Noviherbaspirillum aridicola]